MFFFLGGGYLENTPKQKFILNSMVMNDEKNSESISKINISKQSI